ncbi:MAG: 3-phosphoshikimate 1-carboxyvinyltransferase [Thaumarchaeota archaeon]|nr:3-phosphoshikimate 1-carboxyvinyltransferase [Nitrososphaerota archaeon]
MVSVEVKRSKINGAITCPASKSYTHRAIAIASLVNGKSVLTNVLLSRDTLATINACKKFGSRITQTDGIITISGRNKFHHGNREIDAENSGTTIRVMIAMSALVEGGKTTLTGDESLRKRPMQPLLDALTRLGVDSTSTNGMLPVVVQGGGIKGGYTEINGDVSSQFISALLISCVHADKDVEVSVKGEQVSKPYIDSTLATMERFGVKIENNCYTNYIVKCQQYKPVKFDVPSDFSSAAMMLAAGALAGEVTIKGLNFELPQADAKIIDILHDMGAYIKMDKISGIVRIEAPERLEGDRFNLRNNPDLLPVVSILALKAKNKVTISGVAHARVKETDRITNIVRELKKFGAEVEEFEDGLSIKSIDKLKNTRLNSYNDHRLFMAFCIASLLTDKCVIDGLESVDVSYPNFIDDLRKLGSDIKIS